VRLRHECGKAGSVNEQSSLGSLMKTSVQRRPARGLRSRRHAKHPWLDEARVSSLPQTMRPGCECLLERSPAPRLTR